ncbi:MAG: copper homeostasis protein CutC [Prevotella sp.]|nr:copper homeostasis protein CutC [Prevotella sp.]
MPRNNFEIEICANSVESCLAAQQGGADRVELCMGIPEGGTTPSYGEIKVARELLTTTRLHVIIRNRGGDFLYTPLELKRMAADIDLCHDLHVDGVVFGCLTADGNIDIDANRLLLDHAKDMSVTFHRAFDHCRDPRKALTDLIHLGFDRVLTSGQQPTALDGIPLLRELHQLAGDRIKIMAGCGVNESNIAHIHEATAITNFHFSAREPQRSKMRFTNRNIYMGSKDADETTIMVTTRRRVEDTIKALIVSETGNRLFIKTKQ